MVSINAFLLGQIKMKIPSEIRLEDTCFGVTCLYSYKYPQVSITDDTSFFTNTNDQTTPNFYEYLINLKV